MNIYNDCVYSDIILIYNKNMDSQHSVLCYHKCIANLWMLLISVIQILNKHTSNADLNLLCSHIKTFLHFSVLHLIWQDQSKTNKR